MKIQSFVVCFIRDLPLFEHIFSFMDAGDANLHALESNKNFGHATVNLNEMSVAENV